MEPDEPEYTESESTDQIRSLPKEAHELYPCALSVRLFAFFLDYVLVIAIFYLLTTTILYPLFHPNFAQELRGFWELQQNLPPETGFREMLQQQLDFQIGHERAIADTQFIFIVIVWIYFALSEILMQGSTLGKKVFKLQAIDIKTLKPPMGKTILIRNCLKTISITIVFPFLLLINLIVPFFNRYKLTGHDILSKTMVTYDNYQEINKQEKM